MIRESGCIRGASVLLIWRKREKRLPSDEQFTVNETLLGAWAGATSFQRKDGNSEPPEGNGSNLTLEVHGEKRSNATYESTTDGDARLTKKSAGKKAKLSHAGHVLMENRNGLIGGWKIKPITPFGNSQYQADVYHMLQFCRIRIEVAQNDFLRVNGAQYLSPARSCLTKKAFMPKG